MGTNFLNRDTGFALHLFSLIAFEACAKIAKRKEEDTAEPTLLMANMIRRDLDLLIDRGILKDPEGFLEDEWTKNLSLPVGQFGSLSRDPIDFQRDMLCNVFFNSGVFYPRSNDSTKEVPTYTLKGIQSPIGRQPEPFPLWTRDKPNVNNTYFPRFPLGPDNDTGFLPPDTRPLRMESLEPSSSIRPFLVYIEPPGAPAETVRSTSSNIVGGPTFYRVPNNATLVTEVSAGDAMTSIMLNVEETSGVVEYKTTTRTITLEHTLGRPVFLQNMFTVDMDSFFKEKTEKIYAQTTVQYVVDLLGYISFAFGVTIFSLIVAPSNVFFLGVSQRSAESDIGEATLDANETIDELRAGATGVETENAAETTRSNRPRFRFGVSRRRAGSLAGADAT